VDDSETTLREAWTRAQEKHPDIALPFDDFAAHARRHAAAPTHLIDLYLACACARADAAALRWFDRELLGPAKSAIAGLDASPQFVDEVCQRVRTKLLLADTGRPRIADYEGRGGLTAWVTVAAVRTGLTYLRETKRAEKYAGDGWTEALALPDTGDVEIDLIKQRYREQFTRGLSEACAKLPPRDRTILRMHFVDGLNIDELGVVYGVHRATIARWIAKSRTALLEATRQFLGEHYALPSAELASLDRLVRSQLEVSLGSLFVDAEVD
jgi:RNA polymerase sigma-70 factor (ECF subfamily)